MSTRQRRRPRAGFTLIEALLATALMGAILAALATVTAQWLPNWNRGFARVQRSEHLALGVERLVADLAAAEFIPIGRGTREPLFDGAELSVTFVRSALGPNTRPGLEIVRIAETGSDRGPILVRTRAPFVPVVLGINDRDQPNFADPVVLVRSPFRITFSYAGIDRVWKPTWRGLALLPRAVRVQVRDVATERVLGASTATIVHAELPQICIVQEAPADCLNQLAAPKSQQQPGPPRQL
jgi:general secretion pathway protein J